MNDVDLYKDHNSHQRFVAAQMFHNHGHRIKWKGHGDRIVDIGCGDGGVTVDVLRKFLPSNYERLVGLDINEGMVNHANQQHTDERTSFVVQDIGGVLQSSLRESFDHAFSIYALNWVKNQEGAFRNVYDMLTEGGDLLAIFLSSGSCFEAYRILKQNNKWSSVMGDVENYMPPFQDSKEPEKEVKRLLATIGFKNIHTEHAPKKFAFKNISDLKTSLKAVCPFMIPMNQSEDFQEDYLQVLRDLGYLRKASHPEDEEGHLLGLQTVTVYATKL